MVGFCSDKKLRLKYVKRKKKQYIYTNEAIMFINLGNKFTENN